MLNLFIYDLFTSNQGLCHEKSLCQKFFPRSDKRGLYGQVWIIAQTFVQDGIEELMSLNVNKLPFYQRGLRAMKIIQQGL